MRLVLPMVPPLRLTPRFLVRRMLILLLLEVLLRVLLLLPSLLLLPGTIPWVLLVFARPLYLPQIPLLPVCPTPLCRTLL